MAKGKCLTKLQKEVINDLFSGEKDEQEVLSSRNVGGVTFERWFNNPRFVLEIKRRVQWSELMLLRNKALASKQLAKLIKSKSTSGETARKACLDILKMSGVVDKSVVDADKEKPTEEMAPELAGRVLAAMATAKRGGDSG
jgi:hypothetical protein